MISDAELAFLRARLDEAEQIAKAATPGPWHWVDPGDKCKSALVSDGYDAARGERWGSQAAGWSQVVRVIGDGPLAADADHIARNDPRSALREAETWRRLMLEYSTCGLDAKYKGTERETGYQLALTVALRAKAYEFREHPDYAAAAEASNALMVRELDEAIGDALGTPPG